MGRDCRGRLRAVRRRRRDFSRRAFRFFRRHGERRLGAGRAWGEFALALGRLGFRCDRRNSGRPPRRGRLRGRKCRLAGRGWRRGGKARRRGGGERGWVCLWSGGRGVLRGRRGAWGSLRERVEKLKSPRVQKFKSASQVPARTRAKTQGKSRRAPKTPPCATGPGRLVGAQAEACATRSFL